MWFAIVQTDKNNKPVMMLEHNAEQILQNLMAQTEKQLNKLGKGPYTDKEIYYSVSKGFYQYIKDFKKQSVHLD